MPPFPYTGLSARSEYARQRPAVVVGMLKARCRALHWLYNPANRGRAIEILVSQTKTSNDDAARTYDELVVKYRSYAANGQLTGCTVSGETPTGYGFAAAALKASRIFRMTPRTEDGEPVEGGVVHIPMRFAAH